MDKPTDPQLARDIDYYLRFSLGLLSNAQMYYCVATMRRFPDRRSIEQVGLGHVRRESHDPGRCSVTARHTPDLVETSAVSPHLDQARSDRAYRAGYQYLFVYRPGVALTITAGY